MKFVFLFVLMAFSFGAFAQYQSPEKALYLQKYNRFKSMRTGGILLTVVGAVVTVAGFSNVSSSSTTTNNNGVYYDSDVNSGVLVASLGITMMGGGITLWAIGSKKMKFYQRKMDGVALNLKMTPQQAGLSLNYRF